MSDVYAMEKARIDSLVVREGLDAAQQRVSANLTMYYQLLTSEARPVSREMRPVYVESMRAMLDFLGPLTELTPDLINALLEPEEAPPAEEALDEVTRLRAAKHTLAAYITAERTAHRHLRQCPACRTAPCPTYEAMKNAAEHQYQLIVAAGMMD